MMSSHQTAVLKNCLRLKLSNLHHGIFFFFFLGMNGSDQSNCITDPKILTDLWLFPSVFPFSATTRTNIATTNKNYYWLVLFIFFLFQVIQVSLLLV